MVNDNDLDDDFQQNPGEDNPLYEMKQNQRLEGDDNPPFLPPDGTQDRINDTHPSTDTNIDEMERYNEGIEGAAEVDLPGETADEDQDLPETLD